MGKTCVLFYVHFIGFPLILSHIWSFAHWMAWGQPANLILFEVMKREAAKDKVWSYLLPFFLSTTTTGCLGWAMMESMGYAIYVPLWRRNP